MQSGGTCQETPARYHPQEGVKHSLQTSRLGRHSIELQHGRPEKPLVVLEEGPAQRLQSSTGHALNNTVLCL